MGRSTSMTYRVEEFCVESSDPCEHLRVSWIGFVGVVPYELEFSRVADKHPEAPRFEKVGNPGGVCAGLYGYQNSLGEIKTI